MRVILCRAMLALCAVSSHTMAQGRRDVIEGRVTTERKEAVAGSEVIVTRGPDRAVFRVVTDRDGQYRMVVDSGTGDYFVYIGPPTGAKLRAFRKRVTASSPSDSVFTVHATLIDVVSPQQLTTVRVQGQVARPTRADERAPGPGAAEWSTAGVAALTGPDQVGNLTALAANLPGVTAVAGGVSVFGLPASQNLVLLDGLSFPGAAVPRDAHVTTRVQTSTFDPSRGWFGGAQTRVDIAHDFLYATRRASLSVEEPWLQPSSQLARRSGLVPAKLNGGFGATGFLWSERLSYNASADFTHRTTSAVALDALDEEALFRRGVSRDSAIRFLTVARANGIPTSAVGTTLPTTNSGTLLVSIGTLAEDRNTFRPKRHLGRVSAYMAREARDAMGLSSLRAPSAMYGTDATTLSLQTTLSSFLRPGLLHEVRAAMSRRVDRIAPNLVMPKAVVSVATPSGTDAGLAMLEAGGVSDGASRQGRTSLEVQSETRFFARPGHRVKLAGAVRMEEVAVEMRANAFGTFRYATLGDFAANRPSFFSRQLVAPEAVGRVWNGFVSLGDYWRSIASLELSYGARAEVTVNATAPGENDAIAVAFGERTSRPPSRLHLSPRAGFTWTYRRSNPSGYVVRNDYGSFVVPAVGVLRGGIGEFRSLTTPDALAELAASTGLEGARREITCAGPELAQPNWSAFAESALTIPRDCEAIDGAHVLRDAAPDVRLIARDYTAPRSWRANVAWTSLYSTFVWTLESSYSRNVQQYGVHDLNFSDVPKLSLPEETGRPVFVTVDGVVPGTGDVTRLGSRRNPAFGSVMQTRNSQVSEALVASATVAPDLTRYARARVYASITYSLTDARRTQNGFLGSTTRSPVVQEWIRNPDVPRHAFVVQAGLRTRIGALTLFGRLASGRAYSPMVERDINGDGLPNDRAFVFDPATASDSSVRAGMETLLRRSSPEVRACLQRQIGQLAGANSCSTSWQATLNARLSIGASSSAGWAKRVTASLYVANLPAGLDYMLHGSRLHGWGDAGLPERTLLRPVGFDAATQRFKYQVNPRFGETRPRYGLPLDPFRVTLDVKIDLGVSTDQQILDRSLRSGRAGHSGTRRTVGQIRQFYLRALPDPFAAVLAMTDSLLLTADQVRAVMVGQERYKLRVDSAVSILANWMAALPDRYNAAEALRRQDETFTAVLNIGREETQRALATTLLEVQARLLPWPVDVMLKAKVPLTLREIRR